MLTASFKALPRASRRNTAFTLIELLVVIAVIGVLAALLLPALGRVKGRVLVTKCLSNFREIGLAMQMYKDDNEGRYPNTSGQTWIDFRLGGDSPDADSGSRFGVESATNRLLWQYTTSREVYRCPADRGMNWEPWMLPFNNTYEKIGTSYKYNTGGFWSGESTRLPRKDPYQGLAGKGENWLSQPSHYILLHEPPASPCDYGGWSYFFWHYARGPNTVFGLSQVKDRSISPVLFADGHSAVHDFTGAIHSNPSYPFEPTADWYWYEAQVRTQ